MTQRDPGSFRDPAGRVLHLDGKVYRVVSPVGAAAYQHARDSGLLDKLVGAGHLLPWREVERPAPLEDPGVAVAHVLEHPPLDFVSYPYEWPFAALQAAALLHLDVHLRALAHGVTLSDATAYNVQFDGARPVFIDHLSFRPYRDGEYWLGHRQFCDQFLNPLLLAAHLGLSHHGWYRAHLDGIAGPVLNALLPWYRKLTPLTLLHVTLPALLQARRGSAERAAKPKARLPLASFRHLLTGLRDGIAGLRPRRMGASVWSDYAGNTVYRPEEAGAKHAFVREFVASVRPRVVWDFGCNTGDYAVSALEAGAQRVIGFEGDPATADLAFDRARSRQLAFLPLVMDLANPSPSQGWREAERGGLSRRPRPDAILALALLHHLVIQNNVPLAEAVDWLVSLAPTGVIEFVPKADPMVRRLLALREDVFADYTPEQFLAQVSRRATLTGQAQVTSEGRLLASYRRAP
ncbi:MAG: class I SAM-dependent methyltransferase [Nevskiaceae bacterium]